MKKEYLLVIIGFLFFSCNDHTPKPKGYARIDRNETKRKEFKHPAFSFFYTDDAEIKEVKKEERDEFWFNISYPSHNAAIYCTYIYMHKNQLPGLLEDSYQLAYSHAMKADGIGQVAFSDSIRHKTGILYDIKGAVAVPIQFYVTDNETHFLRGSLYFNDVVQPDSVAPIVSFLRKDIENIIESLKWNSIKQ